MFFFYLPWSFSSKLFHGELNIQQNQLDRAKEPKRIKNEIKSKTQKRIITLIFVKMRFKK